MTRALTTIGALTLAVTAVILTAAWVRERRLARAARREQWGAWEGEEG